MEIRDVCLAIHQFNSNWLGFPYEKGYLRLKTDALSQLSRKGILVHEWCMAPIPGLNLQAPSMGATKSHAWILFGNGARVHPQKASWDTPKGMAGLKSPHCSTFHRISLRFSHCSNARHLFCVLLLLQQKFQMQALFRRNLHGMVSQSENAKVADARGHCDDCPGPQL